MAEGGETTRRERLASRGRADDRAVEVLEGKSKRPALLRLLPFLGPAFIASVAYVDPGNFATNIQGGAKFGYTLVWVVIASNLMAMLIQSLSAKLGIATGRNLPETIRDHFPRPLVWLMWAIAEVVAMATDLAEFLGASIGLNLLFGLPLLPAAFITGLATFLILGLQRYGFRALEAVISVIVGVIALCYVLEMVLARPSGASIGRAIVSPHFGGTEGVLLATGILGATVMPHVIYLHSSLTQSRIVPRSAEQARRIFRFEVVDVVIAMSLAGFVNLAMLVMAAATFHATGRSDVASIEQAYQTLAPLLGEAASVVFAVSLLFSGLSSSTVGTMSGQVVMQGFIHRQVPIWLRRLVTMLPALVVIGLGLNPTRSLVISQVVLSFGIPFALVPLVLFTRRRDIMGDVLVNGRVTTLLSALISALIIALNVFLVYEVLTS